MNPWTWVEVDEPKSRVDGGEPVLCDSAANLALTCLPTGTAPSYKCSLKLNWIVPPRNSIILLNCKLKSRTLLGTPQLAALTPLPAAVMQIVMQFTCGTYTLWEYPQAVVAAPTCTMLLLLIRWSHLVFHEIPSLEPPITWKDMLIFLSICWLHALSHAISIQFLLATFTSMLEMTTQ